MRPRPWRACGVRARDMSSILLCESHGACVRTHASEYHISRIRRHRLTTPSHIVRLCPGRASHERGSMPGGFKSTQAKANKRNAAKRWHGSGTATPTCILGRQHILRRRAQLDEAADAWSRRFSCVYVASCSVVYRVCAYICHFMTALMCCVTGRLVEETLVLGAHILLL